MAQHKKHEPTDTLEELESLGERLMQWVGANPTWVLGFAIIVLLTAAGVGGYRAYARSEGDRASMALAGLRTELIVAMGGKPGETEVPEPANPETARTVRTDFAERHLALAKQFAGTPTQAIALLEAGDLFDQLGNGDRAMEVWTEASKAAASNSPTLGIVYSRIGHHQEDAGDFEGAAKSYEAAAAIPGFPLLGGALSDAARCSAEAGNTAHAVELYQRLKTELPEYQMAPYVEAQLEELTSASPPSAAPEAAAAVPPPAAAPTEPNAAKP